MYRVVLRKPRRRLSISQDAMSAVIVNMHYLSMVSAILRCSYFPLDLKVGAFPYSIHYFVALTSG